jgi:hypothetical protein
MNPSMKTPDHLFRKTFLILSCLTGILLLMVSCLKDMPESVPGNLVWNPDVAIPLGTDQFGLDAASGFDTTLFELDTITNLPKWVEKLELVMEGRVEFDLSSLIADIENLNSMLFRVNIYNGFPNEVLAQTYFLDSSSNPIDSMFANGAITVPAGTVQGNGETIDPRVVRHDAVFENDRIGPLEDASVILFRATILNPAVDSSLIPYYPLYHIDVNIGTMLDLTMEF